MSYNVNDVNNVDNANDVNNGIPTTLQLETLFFFTKLLEVSFGRD